MPSNIEHHRIEKLIETSISGLSDQEALDHVGTLIDASFDAASSTGTDHAFKLLDELQERSLAPELGVMLHYFRSNAWSNRCYERHSEESWAWEIPETQSQILELRCAVIHEGFTSLDTVRQCQIWTNLANQLNFTGRFVEAVEIWSRALRVNNDFAMALGNIGRGLQYYGRLLYDDGHAHVMWLLAHDFLAAAASRKAFFEGSGAAKHREIFEKQRLAIAKYVDVEEVRRKIDLQGHSLGKTSEERAYRAWCLDHRLFINPLNDLINPLNKLRPFPIAARDILTLPDIFTSSKSYKPPKIIGYFNQMKQEYVSARYLYYEGVTSKEVHFSDHDVRLYNTLDYPEYSLASEKIRMAFRVAYSLFDKVSFFLNAYLDIGLDSKQVGFRNIWYEKKGKPRSLLQRFEDHENWPLRGLFWLSKDMFEGEFQLVTEPDAEALYDIRNHLEHKYLQLHWNLSGAEHSGDASGDATNQLAYAISKSDFAAKTLRLLKLARASLIYLSLAVHREEGFRDTGNSMPMPLTPWSDEWKV